MNENKVLKSELSKNGYNLYSINLNSKNFQDKRGYGVIQNQWFDKGSFKVVVRTGLKKDIIVTDEYNENYKRLLLKGAVNKKIPFFINKRELESSNSSSSSYGFMYSLRANELTKIGKEGVSFGLWPKGLKSYDLRLKSVIECNFLYSEKKGTFFSGTNKVEFFLPRGESLRYYSRYVDKQRYFSLIKSLKLSLNIVIVNLESITLERLIFLSKTEQEHLLKRLMILEWLLESRVNSLLNLLDNDSWVWRYNFYYLQEYVKSFIGLIGDLKKVILGLQRLELSEEDKKLMFYRIKQGQFNGLRAIKALELSDKLCQVTGDKEGLNLNRKYFIGFVNEVLKSRIEFGYMQGFNKVEVSEGKAKARLHLVSALDHFFKRSVVSVRSLRKLHKRIWRVTDVRWITGLLSRRYDTNKKSIYSDKYSLRLKKQKY